MRIGARGYHRRRRFFDEDFSRQDIEVIPVGRVDAAAGHRTSRYERHQVPGTVSASGVHCRRNDIRGYSPRTTVEIVEAM